jgi:hypothetical protein
LSAVSTFAATFSGNRRAARSRSRDPRAFSGEMRPRKAR